MINTKCVSLGSGTHIRWYEASNHRIILFPLKNDPNLPTYLDFTWITVVSPTATQDPLSVNINGGGQRCWRQ